MIRERLEPLTDQISLLHGENKGRFPRAHSILVETEETVLIDTGCGIPLLKAIKNDFDISYIINSHTHPDHSAGNWVFRDQTIFVPQEAFNTSGNIVALSHRFVGEELAPSWQQFARTEMNFQNCPPTHSYTEETSFQIGKIVLTPIFTPGHTMDHYCFYYEPQKILFAFDYDLTSFPWYGHQESSLTEFRQSVERLKTLPTKIVVSSHRGIITENILSEWDRYTQCLDERNRIILDLLDSPKTMAQLVDTAPIYRKFPYREPLLRYWERRMIQLHLEELEIKGKVQQTEGQYGRI
ncbi:MAG: MBL fold metallo-hydrolase [Candidatus Hermodarchaeia archaeon]|jgi:glyoxylase-like metal-dependent hydrolase (beta-lactamase superfamily II)